MRSVPSRLSPVPVPTSDSDRVHRDPRPAGGLGFPEKAQLVLHLWAVACLLTLIVKALLQ
jgi:hypothetical protein